MAAQPIKTRELRTPEEIKQFFENIEQECAQVNRDVAKVLEEVFRDRKHVDTWQDLADRVVLALSGKVALIGKKAFDDMTTELWGLTSRS